MGSTISAPVKTADLLAPNKVTMIHLLDREDGEEFNEPLPFGFNRVQDFLDYLNEREGQVRFYCTGWHYEYVEPHEIDVDLFY